MTDTATKVREALRRIAPEGKIKQAELSAIYQIAALWDARSMPANDGEPDWIDAGRTKLGEKEIPGSKHNPWISTGWKRFKAGWFNDDETPWCGFFVAWALDQAGLPYPKEFPRAASYKDYGVQCTPQVGAIAVKARTGGNHVGFIVGETADKRYYLVLGGNQGNMVSIMAILKSDVKPEHVRWPPGVIQTNIKLPVMPKGTVSSNEA